MKIIRVESVVATPSEKGRKKLERINKNPFEEKTDDEGRTAEWYRDLNLSVPKELQEEDNSVVVQEEYLTYADGELDLSYSNAFFNADHLIAVIDNTDFGSTIYLKGDVEITAKQTEKEIFELILNNK